MLRVHNGQLVKFRFAFLVNGEFYDPLDQTTPVDIYATVSRGSGGTGDIIHSSTSLINTSYRIVSITPPTSIVSGHISATFTFDVNHKLTAGDTVIVYGVGGGYNTEYIVTSAPTTTSVIARTAASTLPSLSSYNSAKVYARLAPKTNSYYNRPSDSEYGFYYKIPDNLFGGTYTVSIQCKYNDRTQVIEHHFEVSRSQVGRVGNIVYKKIENGVITLSTDIDHNLSSGDQVSISEISAAFNGNHFISSVPANNKFSIKTNISLSNLEQLTTGKYSVINTTGVSKDLTGPTTGATISKRPIFDSLEEYYNTNSILFIGHSDGIELNQIIKINSIQEASNLLGANTSSPILRGIHDAFSCGAKSIFIMASAPMSEYIEDISQRLTDMPIFFSAETNSNVNFYEKYYERLAVSYDIAKGLDFIDIIVPLETSMINTGSVDFVAQLAVHCYSFNNATGYVQMGIIGSKNNGTKDSDVELLEQNTRLVNKFTTYSLSGEVESDIGRYVIPVYGELTFNHIGFAKSYTSSAAAAFAGMMSSNPVYNGMIRKRIPGAYSVYGSSLSADSLARLDNLGINTVYRTRKALRGNPYEVNISNDYTLANKNSSFTKAPQMRLVAMVITEIKAIANDGIGKNAEDKVISQVKAMLDMLVSTRAIKDYKLQSYGSKTERGTLIFEINLVSSLGLKNINFSIMTGPGA
jgi:hypothetical protein